MTISGDPYLLAMELVAIHARALGPKTEEIFESSLADSEVAM